MCWRLYQDLNVMAPCNSTGNRTPLLPHVILFPDASHAMLPARLDHLGFLRVLMNRKTKPDAPPTSVAQGFGVRTRRHGYAHLDTRLSHASSGVSIATDENAPGTVRRIPRKVTWTRRSETLRGGGSQVARPSSARGMQHHFGFWPPSVTQVARANWAIMFATDVFPTSV